MKEYIKNYIRELIAIEQQIDIEIVEKIISALEKGREEEKRIFVFGNGGSASHANHFSCDLGKNVTAEEAGRFHIISICENMAAVTAYANDIDYNSVFAEQLKNHRLEQGDLILAISASGNSPNVIKACEYAKLKGARIISMTGFTGGKLKELSDLCLHIKSDEYEKVEDVHMAVMHIIVSYFKKRSKGTNEYC